jgi:putative YhdH/YhfP family quinone oxidoreductase
MRCFLVEKDESGRVWSGPAEEPREKLPPGDVTIRVAYSSLNYKDALAASGHPGVVRSFPHIPGIDASGVVEQSQSPKFKPGDAVLATGYELGAERWGGYYELISLPAEWVVPLPEGLSLESSMALGTAGMTAGLSVAALVEHGIRPESGPIVVTGASGGVGSISVAILAKLGYEVEAATGKQEVRERLGKLGAARCLDRSEVADESDRPLLSARWAGAVDTVGGATLSTLVRSLKNDGAVAACGLVGGTDLPISVYPFILRGARLHGIATAWTPYERRLEIWSKLSGPWAPESLGAWTHTTDLDGLSEKIAQILAGKIVGRTVVTIAGPAAT